MAECHRCGGKDAYIHLSSETKAEVLCLGCYNAMMAEELGVEAESYPEGVTLRDGTGKARQFRLRKRLDPIGIIMEAEEQETGGYHFEMYGDLHGDQGDLLLQLIAKAEKGMAEMYVEAKKFPDSQTYYSLRNDRLAGRVEWNPEDEELPVLVVDGKSYTWEEIGKMLMSYEGFQLKLELLEPSEEVNWN